MSIRLKILIALLCTGVIPALSFWWFAETVVHKSRVAEVHNKLQVFADLQALRMAETFRHDSEKVALISSRTQMRLSLASYLDDRDPAKLHRIETILTDALDSAPYFEMVALASMDRQVIASTAPAMRGQNLQANSAYLSALTGSYGYTYVITPKQDGPPGEKVQKILSGPIFHHQQQIGIIIVAASVDDTDNNIDDAAGFGGKGRTRLVRIHKGQIDQCLLPLSAREEGISLLLNNGRPLTSLPDQDDNHTFVDAITQDEHMVAIAPVHNTNLAVVTDIKRKTALQPIDQLVTFGRTVGILSIISILAISIFFARALSRPLRRVAHTAKRISMGDLDARAKVTTHDEVGLLASSFNRMAEKLVNANRTLEKKVRQRTKQLKTTQKLLIQAEKLESLGRLAAGVAHEVKNPLFVIQSGLDYFGMTMKNENEATLKTLELMDEAVQRANKIVLGMLELSRSEEFNLKPVDINELVEKSLVLIDHGLTEKSIYLSRVCHPGIPKVLMDFHKMEQVLINLLDNAISASPKGGSITIKTFTTRLAPVKRNEGLRHFDRLREDDDVAVIEITNTGPPINDANMRKLFDPFFTTKASNEGTGLGLAVCKTIVDLHNGSIHIENVEIPEGVRVSVMLKITSQPSDNANHRSQHP
ncbi:MAG: HAMP domain-containing protein [Akkermansiaceae bacterium]|nr:HAMP domain-containing protein [Akkermansiaceae bacterium]